MRKLLLALTLAVLPSFAKAATIPFVSCPTDSDGGTVTATGSPIKLDIPPTIASRLALYDGAGLSTLAPRGWSCSGNMGGDLLNLSVYPPSGSSDTAPLIRIYNSANINDLFSFGLYFPEVLKAKDVQAAALEMQMTESQFVVPKYEHDTLTYLSKSSLEFVTPANQNGLGNRPGFLPNSAQFTDYGLLSIPADGQEGVSFLGVQLPADMADLKPYIISPTKN